jgi:predicted Zn-dependent protease
MRHRRSALALVLFLLIVACVTSPLGRKQLILVSSSQMNQMGVQAFSELKAKTPIDHDPKKMNYVECIVKPLTEVTSRFYSNVPQSWEVVIFQDETANAFALPGGKIGVHTGILKTAQTDAQLAAILGHEIGHVIAQHGAERVSQQAGTQLGLIALGAITPDNPKKNKLMGLLGVGIQLGVILPFSRTQESEADLIGLDLMGRAGFDPTQSIELWKNMMAAAGGKSPPEWLSTHPAGENRIKNLSQHMDPALRFYQEAKNQGMTPSCIRPD